MKCALIVIDIQNEFLEDPRLAPPAVAFLPRVAGLLKAFRQADIPIAHVHFVTEPDGRGYLPHHQTQGRKRCLHGTAGAKPHTVAEPRTGEPVFAKHAYSAFSSPGFETFLKGLHVDTLILCGLHSHVCVRQTALDALERQYRVLIAADAIATYNPLHGQVTQSFLAERGVRYAVGETLLKDVFQKTKPFSPSPTPGQIYPVACIGGDWVARTTEPFVELRNPSRWEKVLGHVPMAGTVNTESAVSASIRAQREWKTKPVEKRLGVVDKWAQVLEGRAEQFLPDMITEVGKPVTACRAELELLRQSLQVMRKAFSEEPFERICKENADQVSTAKRCPRGVIAILAPWNNPIFLPASKIAAAIALGNGVVWKPALPCARTSMALQDSLSDAGVLPGLVNLIFGGAETAQRLIGLPGIDAVTLTGSVETGRHVAAVCGSLLKPLQAELGGNNAAVVAPHCNLPEVADKIAASAFGYAGQACTATRRVIVLESIEDTFVALLKKSTQALVVGDPRNEETVVGPVISKAHQQHMDRCVAEARPEATVFEREIPDELRANGCWLPPRIIQGLGVSASLVQEESFAPVLVVQTATDLQDAIRLCNQVPHGLIGAIFCEDEQTLQTFRDGVETGIVQLNLPTRNLHMESPFGGWKASGLGPPEHGVWDLDFYTRWQAVNEKKRKRRDG